MSKALMKAGRPIYFSLCEWCGNLGSEPHHHEFRDTNELY
jgi:hypothetical protein